MMARTTIAVLLLAGLSLAGAATAQEGRTIAIQAQLHELPSGGLHMLPERIDARVGDTLVVEVVNQGTTKHNLVFCGDPAGASTCNERMAFTRLLDPGASQEITFTVEDAGTFDYYCDLPGHKQGGMAGTLYVTGESKKNESPGPGPAILVLALVGIALLLRRR